ncbi:unnamed protein product [Camellia sinensis]
MQVEDLVMGTYGYADPEYVHTGVLTEKSDDYGFGMILLELLAGERAYDNKRGKNRELLNNCVEDYVDIDQFNELVDPIILEGGGTVQEQRFQSVIALALRCTQENKEDRPEMIDVAKELRMHKSQHQTPNAWNTPTRVLTDVEQWPKLTTVSPLVANEMMLSNKFGSLSADQRKEVMGSKQRESDKPVRACRNEDSVDLHMEDGSEGLDTLAISGAHKIENQVDEKLWGNLLEDVVSIDNSFFIFKVKSEEAMDTILEDGPYYVGARLIVIKKWQPGLKLTKCEFSSAPLWVKLYNVPLEFWSEEGLGYIASILGTPLYLDEPTFKRSRLTFARICIEVPANKEIPKSFKINLGYGDPYEIQVEVPWKPQRCDGCKTFGHTTNLCPQKPKSLNPPSFKHEWRVKDTKTQIPTKWEVVKKKGRDGGQGSTPLINKERETQSSIPSTSNAFDVLESCDMDELGNGDSSQELRNRRSPSPSDPSYGETSKEDNRRKLKAKLHDLKNARRKF